MQLLFSALTTQSANIAEEGRSLAAVMIRRVITAEFSEFFPKLSAELSQVKEKFSVNELFSLSLAASALSAIKTEIF